MPNKSLAAICAITAMSLPVTAAMAQFIGPPRRPSPSPPAPQPVAAIQPIGAPSEPGFLFERGKRRGDGRLKGGIGQPGDSFAHAAGIGASFARHG